ncbi:hypothetical protein [Vreelandella sulfidaeris]|uniref:Uncharacterized protein n=1 Tax=Vreelandella sulfidaeris TaxID=115553 RepID=A0A455UBK0_9GAMM|nr:hypothetical protein HSBAA_29840 [Halomonas sulfidaeris]
MQTYDAGQSFSLTLDLSLVTSPTSATYGITDQAGVILVTDTTLPVTPTDTSVSIPIDATLTNLEAGARRKMLVITLVVTNDEVLREKIVERVVVQDLSTLTIPGESFQSVNEAALRSMDIPQVSNWESASYEERHKALIEAAYRIKKIRFDLDRDVEASFPEFDLEEGEHLFDDMTQADFALLPAKFIDDLTAAQILEADDILGYGSSAASKRQEGILSDSVGETSQMFRTGKPVTTEVCSRAYRQLNRWMSARWSICRG